MGHKGKWKVKVTKYRLTIFSPAIPDCMKTPKEKSLCQCTVHSAPRRSSTDEFLGDYGGLLAAGELPQLGDDQPHLYTRGQHILGFNMFTSFFVTLYNKLLLLSGDYRYGRPPPAGFGRTGVIFLLNYSLLHIYIHTYRTISHTLLIRTSGTHPADPD